MKKLLCFLPVLALLAVMGCKEESAEQKVVSDTAKVVVPTTTPTPAVAQPVADTTKKPVTETKKK
jgi:hypothetical protein